MNTLGHENLFCTNYELDYLIFVFPNGFPSPLVKSFLYSFQYYFYGTWNTYICIYFSVWYFIYLVYDIGAIIIPNLQMKKWM